MTKPIFHTGANIEFLDSVAETEFNHPIEIWVDSLRDLPKPGPSIKILLLIEPNSILGLREKTMKHHDYFDVILTYDDVLLEMLPEKAVLFEFGTTWIADHSFPDKIFGVSMVCGFKNYTEGHKLRHRIWRVQQSIRIPKTFYVSSMGAGLWWKLLSHFRKSAGSPTLGASKMPLFDTQFHIAIENCRDRFYFSEKLLDCLVTKTVPVYWGCPNIDRYFNPEGIIQVSSCDDLIEKVSRLTPEDYAKMSPAIEENYELAKPYIHYPPRVIAAITAQLENRP